MCNYKDAYPLFLHVVILNLSATDRWINTESEYNIENNVNIPEIF